jgi:hypothetical protein
MPSSAAFTGCDFSSATELGSTSLGGGSGSNANLYEAVATTAGTLSFACQVGTHCSLGQKITVTVAASCGAASPSPSTPPTSPSAPPTSSPNPPSPPPPSPPATLGGSNPCFPGEASVIRANGHTAKVATLKAGDAIRVVGRDGALRHDTVSRFSQAYPHAVSSTMVELSTEEHAHRRLRLTADHRVSVGPACCAELAFAKDITVGTTVWVLPSTRGPGGVSAPQLTAVNVSAVAHGLSGHGLHNPLMVHGGFPLVDGVATAFESALVVFLASLVLPYAEAACDASSAACLAMQHVVAAVDGAAGERRYVDGTRATGSLAVAVGASVAAVAASSWAWWLWKASAAASAKK